MYVFKLIKLTIKLILNLLVPPGREEGPDHCADRCPASIRHPRWGHQPLHGHLQEDGWRVRRPLCLLLHLHHLARDPAARWFRDSLMDQEDLFNLASLFQHPLLTSPIATRQGHLRRLTSCCRRQSVNESSLPCHQGRFARQLDECSLIQRFRIPLRSSNTWAASSEFVTDLQVILFFFFPALKLRNRKVFVCEKDVQWNSLCRVMLLCKVEHRKR